MRLLKEKRKLMKFDSFVTFLTIIYIFLVITAMAFKELVYDEFVTFLGERKHIIKNITSMVGGRLGLWKVSSQIA